MFNFWTDLETDLLIYIELKWSIYVKFLGISVRQNMIELHIQPCFMSGIK